jgi:hypothetical protein
MQERLKEAKAVKERLDPELALANNYTKKLGFGLGIKGLPTFI